MNFHNSNVLSILPPNLLKAAFHPIFEHNPFVAVHLRWDESETKQWFSAWIIVAYKLLLFFLPNQLIYEGLRNYRVYVEILRAGGLINFLKEEYSLSISYFRVQIYLHNYPKKDYFFFLLYYQSITHNIPKSLVFQITINIITIYV